MTMNQIRENVKARAIVDAQSTVEARFEMEIVRARLVQAGAAYSRLTVAMVACACKAHPERCIRWRSLFVRRDIVDREITRLALQFSDMERGAA